MEDNNEDQKRSGLLKYHETWIRDVPPDLPTNGDISFDERVELNGITRLMRAFSTRLAPPDLRNNEIIREFLDANEMEGTFNQVLVARLYALAIYGSDTQAHKLIYEILEGKGKEQAKQFVVNFIMPANNQQAKPDLENDEWTVPMKNLPGESKPG